MAEALQYNATVLDHFHHPRNAGPLPDANAVAENANPAMHIRLMLRIQEGRIEAAHFQTRGCPASIATSSAATVLLTGRTIGEARALTRSDFLDAVDGLPKSKHHCPALVAKTVQDALDAYAATASAGS